MKLVYCPVCGDVLRLIELEWRECYCGHSGGQYNKDLMTATVGGRARVLGVANFFFEHLFPRLSRTQKRKLRKDLTGQPDTDCWWSQFPERDMQIVAIKNPAGPRIRMRVETRPGAKRSKITITDRRQYTVAGKRRRTW